MKKLTVFILLLAVITATILVPAVAAETSHSSPSSGAVALSSSDNAAIVDKTEFRQDMRKLWEDHIIWTRQVIVSLLGGLPDLDAAVARLLQNQVDIGDAIKPYFGNAAGDQLTGLLRQHILIAADLLTAAKSDNSTAFDSANTAWYANADNISVFLSTANPQQWPLDQTKALMKRHLDTTLAEAVARLHADWAADVAAFDAVHEHILMMADFLSEGIIARVPQKFAAVAGKFNTKGNVLISDQFNNRVIEVAPDGAIIWQYGVGPSDNTASSPLGVNDAQRVGKLTLIAATGVPAGAEPGCPNGCPDNRVLLVDEQGNIVWQYGQFGVTGSGPNELDTPVQSTWLPNGHVLITDQGNQRVIEVNRCKEIVWQYGTTGVSGNGFNQLNDPNSAELLKNGHILIADENNNRAIEVTRSHKIVATYTAGGTLSGVAFASRLPGGNTLITDSNNSRIVEVSRSDKVVWEYFTNTDNSSNQSPLPSRALRLKDGNTIISDQFNHRVIVVDHGKNIVAAYGNLNQAGFGNDNTDQGLNAPYDAKVIGDYTGITPVRWPSCRC